jgi:gliding motility-associated-like protein
LEKNASIEWTTPYRIIYNTKKIVANTSVGKYYVKVTSGKNVYFDSTFIKMYPKPKRLLRDTTVCKSKTVVLDAKNQGARYFWNTGDVTEKIRVEASGKYWVRINNGGCGVIDSVNVKIISTQNQLNSEHTFCLSESNKLISIKPGSSTKILWSNGSTGNAINALKEGVYWVQTESKQCGKQTDSTRVKFKACDCEMLIPNSFTPNEDNKNDYFFPVLQCEYTYFNLVISDRYGNTVFVTSNPNAKWDGRYKGNLCPEDNYVYTIESIEKGSEKKAVRNGYISLFR